MTATGIFLFLLGMKLGWASVIQSDFVYQPSKLTVREEIDQSSFLIPESELSPYLTNGVHQVPTYFFGVPFSMPKDVLLAPKPEKTATEIIQEERKNVTVSNANMTKLLNSETVPVHNNPVIDGNGYKASQHPRLSLPIPNIALNIQPIPHLPSLSIPIVNSQLISQLPLPLQSLNVPGLPFLKSSKTSDSRVPLIIEEPRTSDLSVSEVDVLVKKIPPPPELPPLNLEDILKPVIIEEKNVILIPSPPEVQAVLPPSAFISEQPCHPTMSAQHIVYERILPNILS